MKTILMLFGMGLLSFAGIAQQNGKTNEQQNKPKSTSQSSNKNQSTNNQNVNRNEDRAIGNKNDKDQTIDTSRGTGSTTPHEKTPAERKAEAKPDPTSTNSNTPNAMTAEPSRPDPSTEYNRSSNGGIGLDTMRRDPSKANMQNASAPSQKGEAVTKGRNTVPTQQTDKESDQKDPYRKGKPQYKKPIKEKPL
ncbi:hypothetical protein [Xanthocytophaga flava]|uniref:hypothetical protein n=1 Tax=Xanthocytophaga flava TaxID=3048013 RepID=UPI0028D82863|nr:hypothetical protein [Xanthocytophaga flavus]MDJ1468750.1 hypothetical protein [Xanthocytophaga flavus]